jgi:hypothetical protein
VNGFALGAQQVSSEFSKQVLSVNIDEPIGFVEVFSEQGLRLLFFDVDQPIDGSVEQTARAEFDLGRELDLSLSFRGPWPTLNVSYHDPTFEAVESSVQDSDSDVFEEGVIEQGAASRPKIPIGGVWPRRRAWLRSSLGGLDLRLFLRPGVVTASFALVLIAALVILYRNVPTSPLTAADLLQRAVAAENVIASNRDQVTHRTLRLEEKSSAGQLLSSRRVEVWHSAANGVTARRLYDENGTLIAGDWRRADGVQTIYHHGKRPQLQLVPDKRAAAPISFGNVWQLDPSARDFSSLIANTQGASATENSATYVINYASDPTLASSGLIKASLVLGRSDLSATEQTLVIKQGDETREYKFVEAGFERRAPNSVSPAVFEPEASLIASTGPTTASPKSEANMSISRPSSSAPFLASPELELQILKQLNQADAFYGEQIGLTRTPEGRLYIQGLVETDKRKAEILQALSSVRHNPAVQIQVETVAEAATRQARQRSSTGSSTEIGTVEIEAKSALPVESELRAYLSSQKGLSNESLDQEVRRYADRVMSRTRQARRHALALKQIAERFSPDDLRALDSESRNQWRAMIGQHAAAIQQELDALLRDLKPLFPYSSSGESESQVAGDADLAGAAKRLFELASAVDESVGKSFSIYASGNNSAPVKTGEFSRSLNSAISLARKLQATR